MKPTTDPEGDENVDRKFRAAWQVFAITCCEAVAPEATFQAWFAHYLISQFGIDRVAREPDFGNRRIVSDYGAHFANSNSVMVDVVVTRTAGIHLPRRSSLTDRSGAERLPDLAVISELKVASTQGEGLDNSEVCRDFWKLSMLLDAADSRANNDPAVRVPLAYVCVLDNHGKRRFGFDWLETRLAKERFDPRVTLLRHSIEGGTSG
jgi:hypothetical protein